LEALEDYSDVGLTGYGLLMPAYLELLGAFMLTDLPQDRPSKIIWETCVDRFARFLGDGFLLEYQQLSSNKLNQKRTVNKIGKLFGKFRAKKDEELPSLVVLASDFIPFVLPSVPHRQTNIVQQAASHVPPHNFINWNFYFLSSSFLNFTSSCQI
jgi:hypothetical protein